MSSSSLLDGPLLSCESQNICSTCDNILGNLPVDQGVLDPLHHKTFSSFQLAIQGGCYICKRVRESALGTDFEDWVVKGNAIAEELGSFTSHRFCMIEIAEPVLTLRIRIGDSEHETDFFLYRYQGKWISVTIEHTKPNSI